MEKVIKKAIEGGYEMDRIGHPKSVIEREHYLILDPLFWKALGKACGWGENCTMCSYNLHAHKIIQNQEISTWNGSPPCDHYIEMSWKSVYLKFHEINITEGWEKAVKYLEDLIR